MTVAEQLEQGDTDIIWQTQQRTYMLYSTDPWGYTRSMYLQDGHIQGGGPQDR